MLFPFHCVAGKELAFERTLEGWNITKIEWSDEENINAVDSGNLVDFIQGLLRLDLHDGEESVIGMLKVLGHGRHRVEPRHGVGRAEAAAANRRKFGRLHKVSGFLSCP